MSSLEGKVLVLLNANAGSYSDDTFWQAWGFAQKHEGVELRRTQDPDDAQGFVKDALATGDYSIIVQGGGDGTLGQILQWQQEYLNSSKNGACRPLKILPTYFGTGNAIAREAGASPRKWMHAARKLLQMPYEDIPTLQRKLLEVDFQRFGETDSTQRVALLAGVGIDAQFIGKYEELKQEATKQWNTQLRHGVLGYLAVIPHAITMLQKRPSARIELPETSYRVHGIHRLGKNESLCKEQQRFIVASAGQVSQFGARFKAFPSLDYRNEILANQQVDPQKYMQVVLAQGSAAQIARQMLGGIIPLWFGKYRPQVLEDYLTTKIKITSEQGVNLQLNGDPMGLCSRVEIKSSENYAGIIDCRSI